jgi:hypothetical protein
VYLIIYLLNLTVIVDNFIIRNREILRLDIVRLQTVSSLQNWTAGTACITRAETAYLKHPQDLFSIASADDAVVTWLETGRMCLDSSRAIV